MRPPSYYASLSTSNYNNNNSYSSSPSSYNGYSSSSSISSSYNPSSHQPMNRSSSSHQLRTNFSSPSSSSYVTRSHLPFVSQSMLVAHCFTGVSSSTKPNYGQQNRSSCQPSYSSGSTYSTSYSRPKSLKRYQQPSSSSLSSSSSSSFYLSPSYTKPSSSSTTTIARSYLSSSSRTSSTYKRSPATSTYYPQPIRLRERPLLTQISRQINTQSSSYRPSTPAQPSSTTLDNSHSTRPFRSSVIVKPEQTTKDETLAPKTSEDSAAEQQQQQQQQQQQEAEESWSSDVARNISRNKYLIKFREIEKRSPVGQPIQLTNRVEPEKTSLALEGSSSTQPANDLVASPEASAATAPVELPVLNLATETQIEQSKLEEKSPTMKVPLNSQRRPSATEKQLLEQPAVKKVTASLMPTNNNDTSDIEKVEAVEPEERKKAPKEKRNIKLKIRTMSNTPAYKPEVQSVIKTTTTKELPAVEEQPASQEAIRAASTTDTAQQSSSTTNTSDSQPAKPKPLKKLVKKSSSKRVALVKTPSASKISVTSPEIKAADAVEPPTTTKENHSPDVKVAAAAKQQVTPKERRKSTPKVEDAPTTCLRKVLAPKQQEPSPGSPEKPPVAIKHRKKEEKEAPLSLTSTLEVTTPAKKEDAEMVQQNKRIRFRDYHLEDFNFLSVLGHGGWGFVILAELKEHDACFAVKCIKKITIVEDDDFDSIMIERKVLTLGNVHPFICKLFCTFETEGYLFFVMEYCAGGDLMFHVQKEGKFTESRCRFYAAEIICAIRFLHNRHIIYRDLKLDNILLDSRGHVRLVDFGMCQCRTYREEMLPSNFCGTPEYISPEIIKGVPYNHSVDWWSFGVLLYEMAVGKMPFRGNDENELLWNVCYEQIHYPMFLTKELTSLLQSLLEREPTKRMGMATCKAGDIYDQAWFRGVDWKAMEEMRVPPPFVPEVNSKRDVQNFDADFTESRAELSPVDEATLQRIDQTQFQRFPYTNPDIFIFESLCS